MGMLQDRRCRVLLAEVADVLAGARFELPEELRALALEPAKPEAQAAAPVLRAPVPAVPVLASEENWKEQAQNAARERLKRAAVCDLYPSQNDIADGVAADLRKRSVFGSGGKPLTGSTIKRHALKGISSATKKSHSITVKRGK